MKLHVDCALDLRPVGRGHELGVVALGHVLEALHLTLHVDRHQLYGAGHQCQFLLQEVSGAGNAVAHEHFIG